MPGLQQNASTVDARKKRILNWGNSVVKEASRAQTRGVYVPLLIVWTLAQCVVASGICNGLEEQICLYYNPLTKQLKQNPRTTPSVDTMRIPKDFYIKEFHQKDHHHSLNKYVAYRLSRIALQRLEQASEALSLPYYFPRILGEINNLTYKIDHVGWQSDQFFVVLDEDTIGQQVHAMRQIMEYAGVMHMDYEPHCKNIVYNEVTGRISLIDWDIIALKSDTPITGANPIWADEHWYPNTYADRFLDMRGWDNLEQRLFDATKACLSPTCFCRARS
jgi:hypothetical protein